MLSWNRREILLGTASITLLPIFPKDLLASEKFINSVASVTSKSNKSARARASSASNMRPVLGVASKKIGRIEHNRNFGCRATEVLGPVFDKHNARLISLDRHERERKRQRQKDEAKMADAYFGPLQKAFGKRVLSRGKKYDGIKEFLEEFARELAEEKLDDIYDEVRLRKSKKSIQKSKKMNEAQNKSNLRKMEEFKNIKEIEKLSPLSEKESSRGEIDVVERVDYNDHFDEVLTPEKGGTVLA